MLLIMNESSWYMSKNRHVQAYRSLSKLRVIKLQAARDVFRMHVHSIGKPDLNHGLFSFTKLFSCRRIRRAAAASQTLVLVKQVMYCLPLVLFPEF